MKTVCITLVVILLSTALYAQDKSATPKGGIKLFTLQLHNQPPQKSNGIDTLKAEITVAHKVGRAKPNQTFIGWIVRTGANKRFYSEAWDPMPSYYVVRDVKEL